MARTKTTTKRGNLRIGNQWNAITIIARSQTYPLKAVCELVENAIDAQAREVHLVRRRKRGRVYLELWDDGTGVALNDDGEPDFSGIATHVCDSMKRHLSEKDRDGVEYGWELREGVGTLVKVEGARCRVTSQQAGQAVVRVTATQNEHRADAECTMSSHLRSPMNREIASDLRNHARVA